jgi:hypothetical protein
MSMTKVQQPTSNGDGAAVPPLHHLEVVDELMRGSVGIMGAYCMGMLTHLGMTTGRFPPRPVLEVAAMAQTLEDCVEIYGVVSRYQRGAPKQLTDA